MRKENMQNILVVGSGGREHALGWKLKQSGLFFAPGNGGTETLGKNVSIGAEDIDRLAAFAKDPRNNIGLTIVGPEVSLVKGLVNQFNKDGLLAFGPTEEAARLEGSKVYTAYFTQKYGIPHPRTKVFRDVRDAYAYIESGQWDNDVIKADGLCAGKGVELPDSREEAKRITADFMVNGKHGDAGKIIVMQERLQGPELSMLAFSDGATVVPMLPAQDYKRAYDGDTVEGKGPNTGGMASYAPVDLPPELLQQVYNDILQPTITHMREDEGHPYKGILYAGLMLTDKGPKVLEYNCRFGDPETQPLMMLSDFDLAEVALSCIDGTLDRNQVRFKKGASACVVLASGGYPGKYKTGFEIYGLPVSDPNIEVFHAGTIMKNGRLETNGGRVMGVTAFAPTVGEAFTKANSVIGEEKGIHFEGMQHRQKFL